MLFTYIIIFLFFLLLGAIVFYSVYTYVLPKKIDEIARLVETGQTKLAIRKLNELLEKDDRNPYAHYLLAESYMKEGNTQYAIIEYRQVIKFAFYDRRVKEADVRSKLARLYRSRKATEEAKKEYLILTKIDPGNADNYHELGVIYFDVGVTDKAVSFFKKALALNPKNESSYYYLGQIYYRHNSLNDAKQMFLESIKLDPSNVKAHYFLGLVLRQQGDYEWAIKEFEIAQKSEDLKVKCLLAKGTCYMEKSQYPKAIMEFERGVKFARRGSETELNIRYYMAESQEKMRDVQSAIKNWERINEINSNFRDVPEKLKFYAEFRQDDRIKDFLIAGLSHFEHNSRKIVESMGHKITDVDILSDTEIEIIATESDGKWRNTRQTNKIIRVIRTTDTVQEKLLRDLHESMKPRNASRIMIITTGDFSKQAVDFANTRPIELYEKSDLVDLLKKT